MHIRERGSRRTGTQKTVTSPVRRPNPATTTTATRGADRDFNQLERRPLSERAALKCTKCGKIGHTQDRCYPRNFQLTSQRNLPPPYRVNQTIPEEGEDYTDNQEYESTAPQEENYLPYNYEDQTDIYEECSLTPEQA